MAAVSEPEGRAGPEQEGEEGAAGASVLASQLVSCGKAFLAPQPAKVINITATKNTEIIFFIFFSFRVVVGKTDFYSLQTRLY